MQACVARAAALLVCLIVAGCAHALKGGPSPAADLPIRLDGIASFDVYAEDGRVHALAAGESGGKPALQYLRSTDGGTTWPLLVSIDPQGLFSPTLQFGNDVQVAAAGSRAVAVWAGKSLHSAVSEDAGMNWKAGPNPADDGSSGGHAFIDLWADRRGRFHLVWLDARARLYYSNSEDGLRWSRKDTLEKVTCERCWNRMSGGTGEDLYVLYRGFKPRDMALKRSQDGGRTWNERGPVGSFGWNPDACPRGGGGIAVDPGTGTVHAVVWTGKDDQMGIYHLASRDGGDSWSPPSRVCHPHAKHADIAARGDRVAVVWDMVKPEGRLILSGISQDGGITWPPHHMRLSSPSASATHPRVMALDTGFRAFWAETRGDKGTFVRTCSLAP